MTCFPLILSIAASQALCLRAISSGSVHESQKYEMKTMRTVKNVALQHAKLAEDRFVRFRAAEALAFFLDLGYSVAVVVVAAKSGECDEDGESRSGEESIRVIK